jgi:Cellulose binding domain
VSLAFTAALAAALLTPATPAVTAEDPICHVGYRTEGNAASFTAYITITNLTAETLYGWTLFFPLPAGQVWQSGWEATFTVTDRTVTGVSLPYNSNVESRKSVSVGYWGWGDAAGPGPSEFRVNGHLCATG